MNRRIDGSNCFKAKVILFSVTISLEPQQAVFNPGQLLRGAMISRTSVRVVRVKG